jgi:hypothetical protein
MKLLADENFPLASIKLLSQAGHDIIGIGLDYHGLGESIPVPTYFGFTHFKAKCQNNAVYKIEVGHNQRGI